MACGHGTRRVRTSATLACSRAGSTRPLVGGGDGSRKAAHVRCAKSSHKSADAVAIRRCRQVLRSTMISRIPRADSNSGDSSDGNPSSRAVAARRQPPVGRGSSCFPKARTSTSVLSASDPSASIHPKLGPPVILTQPFGDGLVACTSAPKGRRRMTSADKDGELRITTEGE